MSDLPNGYSVQDDQDAMLELTLGEIFSRLNAQENFGMILIPGAVPRLAFTATGEAAINSLGMLADAGVIRRDQLEQVLAAYQGFQA